MCRTITLPTGNTDGLHDVASDKTVVGIGSDARLVGGLNIGLPVDDDVASLPANAVHNVASTMNAGVVLEGNYFVRVNNPPRVDLSGDLGRLVARDDVLVDCNHAIETQGTVPEAHLLRLHGASRR